MSISGVVLTNKVLLLLGFVLSGVVVFLVKVNITELVDILVKAHDDFILLVVLLFLLLDLLAFRFRLDGLPLLLLLGWHLNYK